MIIAVDGSAASGKGTLAKRLAAHFDLAHLDTGALYRMVGLAALEQGLDDKYINENQAVNIINTLNLSVTPDDRIRNDKVAKMASIVAAMPPVRARLLDLQRHFAAHPTAVGGAILDGRDIGSVVLPDADYKFFVDANIDIRAERRTKELHDNGQSVMFRHVLEDMKARDQRDRNRDIAPLVATFDAMVIDTSDKDADMVLALALAHIAG
ncbi:(d)CMP kinase [Candidatus Puniceispirillum sp.]|uniref:(d)CMP kinase n=1 Tax=Candidatus Puniceispirillum sp. TaxID=2026719 RepID=UPI003F69A01A